MKGSPLGYHNRNFVFSADIQINSPSGFALHLSKTGDPIYNVVSFSGYSGYIFDQRGYFIGGYRKNQVINISGNYFFGDVTQTGSVVYDDDTDSRFSYFLNNRLISNCISGQSGYFDTVLFEDYGANTLNFNHIKETRSPNIIVDVSGVPIQSSEGYFLAGS